MYSILYYGMAKIAIKNQNEHLISEYTGLINVRGTQMKHREAKQNISQKYCL